MAKRTQPPEINQAQLTHEQMKAAIPLLENRIKDLENLDLNLIKQRSGPEIQSLENKVNDTLEHVFGHDTVEYRRYRANLDTAGFYIGHQPPMHEIVEGYKKGISLAVANLKTIIELFNERLNLSVKSPVGRARNALAALDIHPEILCPTSKLFHDGHYANAIEDSCKILDLLVKMRSGRTDLSGTDLMQTVFSPNNPILAFNDLLSETDKSEQKGMMFLYAGAMLALRNPRAHEIVKDDPEKALEIIAFLSYLAKSLDKAKKI